MNKTYIGIDPGKGGGIAFIGPEGTYAHKMPDSMAELWELFPDIAMTPCFALIERVSSSPQMGVCSAFTFGRGYGALEMALAASEIPHEAILPQKWQKELGCLSGGDKRVTQKRAQGLFPAIRCTHAISDALLLAEYARRKGL